MKIFRKTASSKAWTVIASVAVITAVAVAGLEAVVIAVAVASVEALIVTATLTRCEPDAKPEKTSAQ